jgi:hypothetical protein
LSWHEQEDQRVLGRVSRAWSAGVRTPGAAWNFERRWTWKRCFAIPAVKKWLEKQNKSCGVSLDLAIAIFELACYGKKKKLKKVESYCLEKNAATECRQGWVI